MPDGKPGEGTVFFVYRAKMHTGSSIHTAGAKPQRYGKEEHDPKTW